MVDEDNFDVIVVGGGIAGLLVSYFMPKDIRVLLIEKHSMFGAGSTGRAFGNVSLSYGHEALQSATEASLEFYGSLTTGTFSHPLMSKRGEILLASNENSISQMNSDPYAEQISRTDAISRSPLLSNLGKWTPFHIDESYDFDPLQVIATLTQGINNFSNVRILWGSKFSGAERKHNSWFVRTSRQTYRSEYLVNAAGAEADLVAMRSNISPLGIKCFRRTVTAFQANLDETEAHSPLVATDSDIPYFRPAKGAIYVSPGERTESKKVGSSTTSTEIKNASRLFSQLSNFNLGTVKTSWAGLRCFLPDNLPCVGSDAASETFIWLAGLGGHGIQSGPALASAAVKFIDSRFQPLMDLDQRLLANRFYPFQ